MISLWPANNPYTQAIVYPLALKKNVFNKLCGMALRSAVECCLTYSWAVFQLFVQQLHVVWHINEQYSRYLGSVRKRKTKRLIRGYIRFIVPPNGDKESCRLRCQTAYVIKLQDFSSFEFTDLVRFRNTFSIITWDGTKASPSPKSHTLGTPLNGQ